MDYSKFHAMLHRRNPVVEARKSAFFKSYSSGVEMNSSMKSAMIALRLHSVHKRDDPVVMSMKAAWEKRAAAKRRTAAVGGCTKRRKK